MNRPLLPVTLALTLCLAVPSASLAAERIWVLSDPKGDDYGDGILRYPTRPDMREGDLDLVELAAESAPDGTWFVAKFRRDIRRPGGEVVDSTGKPLEDLARYGFYLFNIDIYIDMDRIEGSGHTFSMPGREVTINPSTAWERVVSLSPLPDQTAIAVRQVLVREAKQDVRENKARVDDEDVDLAREYGRNLAETDFWFARSVHVAGRTVRFFVPSQFLGGKASPGWAYTVIVTGANIEVRYDTSPMLGKVAPVYSYLLIPVGTGLSRTHFMGRDEDPLQPPVIDTIVPEGTKQEDVLRDYDLRTGRQVMLTGVVPRGNS